MKRMLYIGSTLALIVLGYISGEDFNSFSRSSLGFDNFQSTTLSGHFNLTLYFVIALGLIPLLHYVSSRFSNVNSLRQKGFIIGIILVMGNILWQLRMFQLKWRYITLNNFGIEPIVDITQLKFSQYLFLGFVLGAIISYMIFSRINRKQIS